MSKQDSGNLMPISFRKKTNNTKLVLHCIFKIDLKIELKTLKIFII